MSVSVSEQERLYGLLQRAAEELKFAQRAAAEAQQTLERERAEHRRVVDELRARLQLAEPSAGEGEGGAAPPSGTRTLLVPQAALTTHTDHAQAADPPSTEVPEAERSAGAPDGREQQIAELSAIIERLRAEQVRDSERFAELEAKLLAGEVHGASPTESSPPAAPSGLVSFLGEGGHEGVAPSATPHRAPAASQGGDESSIGVEEERARADLSQQRVTQLEGELVAIRHRRDELNLQLAHAESGLRQSQAKLAELETAEARRRDNLQREHLAALEIEVSARAQAEGALRQEQERHQESRSQRAAALDRLNELQGEVENLKARAAAREEAAQQGAEANRRARSELEAQLGLHQRQLEHAHAEWHHVEKQYEQLHKEMLLLLDQRDDARRERDALKARFGL